jgi:glycosyltransferase involved in cell wall biosynthesis
LKIAIITPYYKESAEQLKRCHDSVLAQTLPCRHVLVSDGYPNPVVDTFDAAHLKVPNHGDYGDTPRLMGAAHAASAGYDAILLLDADNWFDPDHVEKLVTFQKTVDAPVITCGRTLIHCETLEPFGDCPESTGGDFVDTNCFMLMRPAFPYFAGWGFKPPSAGIIGDRIFWNTLKRAGLKTAHSPENGVNYVSTFAFHYLHNKMTPPQACKAIVDAGGGNLVMRPFYEAYAEGVKFI